MSDTCWRHARRGTTYAHLATGIIESDHPVVEGDRVVVHLLSDGTARVCPVDGDDVMRDCLGVATVQAGVPLASGSPVVVYRGESDRKLWVRSTLEFYDGRFELETDMSYRYDDQRDRVFTEEGQRLFLKIRDRSKVLITEAGAAMMERLIAGGTGLSWDMLACVDRLVELGELREVQNPHSSAGQHRLFIKGGES